METGFVQLVHHVRADVTAIGFGKVNAVKDDVQGGGGEIHIWKL